MPTCILRGSVREMMLWGNCAVLLAALGVFRASTGWPDIAVAAIKARLALQGGPPSGADR